MRRLVETCLVALALPFYVGLVSASQMPDINIPYDKFTLGAKVTAGDPFDLANPIVRAGRQSSFDAFDGETSRVVAAGAVVAALRHPSAVELTVSAAKGGAAPTEEEWDVMLRGL